MQKQLESPSIAPIPPSPSNLERRHKRCPTPDISTPLDEKRKKRIQKVVGGFLYYDRAVDLTILCALNAIAGQQANPTEETERRVKQLFDYMSTQMEAKIWYHASDMMLNVHSNASYLTALKARSRARGHFFMGSLAKHD